jgi:hypothetical protein
MEHALGRTPDSRNLLLATFNRAGRRLFTARGWTWRIRGPVPLAVTADETVIQMPADFDRICTLSAPREDVEIVSLDYIMQLRREEYAGTRWYLYLPKWEDNAGGEPVRNALIYPTPTTTGTPALEMTYYRKWPTFTADQTDRIPPIPESFEHLLVLLARAFARTLEDDDADPCEMPSIRSEITDLAREDAAGAARQGPLPMTIGYHPSTTLRRGRTTVLGGLANDPVF